MQNLTYRIDFWLDASEWNEGYEKAADPWLRLYTDDRLIAGQFPDGVTASVTGQNRMPQLFTVAQKMVLADELTTTGEVLRWQSDHGQDTPEEIEAQVGNPDYDGTLRYRWLVGRPTQDVLELITDRLDAWEGI